MSSIAIFFRSIPVLLALCITLSPAHSQPKNMVIPDIHYDYPRWMIPVGKNISSSSFWPGGSATDAEGNTYFAARFSGAFEISGRQHSARSQQLLMVRVDSNGAMRWSRTGEGFTGSTASAVAVDDSGNAYFAGEVWGRKGALESTDSLVPFTAAVDGPRTFLAKYHPDGTLLWVVEYLKEEGFEPSGMTVGRDGDIYVAGRARLHNPRDRSAGNYAGLLVRFDRSGKQKWEYLVDGPGSESCGDVTTDGKGNCYLAGSYNDSARIGEKLLRTGINASGFVVRFNSRGKPDWHVTLNSSNSGLDEGSYALRIRADRENNIYLLGLCGPRMTVSGQKEFHDTIFGRSVRSLFLMRMLNTGAVKWAVVAHGRSTVYAEGLELDRRGNIYICGQGYGGAFKSTDGNEKVQEAEGGTEPFFARYDPEGGITLLGYALGRGTDYADGIGLDRNGNLYITGISGSGSLRLGDSTFVNRYTTLFTARIDAAAMGKNFIPTAVAREVPPEDPVNRSTCQCSESSSRPIQFAPMLSGLADNSDFEKASGFRRVGVDSAFDATFFMDLQNQSHRSGRFFGMTLIAYRSLRLQPVGGGPILNLTPCLPEKRAFAEVPVRATVEQEIVRYGVGIDEESFDRRARSYYDLMSAVAGKRHEEFLADAMRVLGDRLSRRDLLGELRADYDLDVRVDDSLSDMKAAAAIVEALDEKDLSVYDVVYDIYLKKHIEDGDGMLDSAGSERLETLFTDIFSLGGVDRIDRMIRNSYHVEIDVPRVSVEFDTSHVRRWDPAARAPFLDSMGRREGGRFLVDVKSLTFRSEGGLQLKRTGGICVPPIELTGTGIVLTPGRIVIDLDPNNDPPELGEAAEETRGDIEQREYDYFAWAPMDLEPFVGVGVMTADVMLTVNGKRLSGSARDIGIREKKAFGVITIPGEANNDTFTANGPDGPVTINIDTLRKQLHANGVDNAVLVDDVLTIYFAIRR